MRDKEAIETERKNLARTLEKQGKLLERLSEGEKTLIARTVCHILCIAFWNSLLTESARVTSRGRAKLGGKQWINRKSAQIRLRRRFSNGKNAQQGRENAVTR